MSITIVNSRWINHCWRPGAVNENKIRYSNVQIFIRTILSLPVYLTGNKFFMIGLQKKYDPAEQITVESKTIPEQSIEAIREKE